MILASGGALGGPLGALLGRLGGFMSLQGAILGRLGAAFAGFEAILSHFEALLGPQEAKMPKSTIFHWFLYVFGPQKGSTIFGSVDVAWPGAGG